jgi:hypothetical protein
VHSCVTCVLGTISQGDEPLTLTYLIIPQLCRKTMWQLFHALPQGAFSFSTRGSQLFAARRSWTFGYTWTQTGWRCSEQLKSFWIWVSLRCTHCRLLLQDNIVLIIFHSCASMSRNLFQFHNLISQFSSPYGLKINYKHHMNLYLSAFC